MGGFRKLAGPRSVRQPLVTQEVSKPLFLLSAESDWALQLSYSALLFSTEALGSSPSANAHSRHQSARHQHCFIPRLFALCLALNQKASQIMASSLTTSKPTSTCLSYHQHNVQVQVLCAARKSARQCSWQQTAITATSRSTNDTAAVRTTRQRQYGLRQQLIVPFARRTVTVSRAFGESSGSSKDPSLQDYVEVKIESVKVNQGTANFYVSVSTLLIRFTCESGLLAVSLHHLIGLSVLSSAAVLMQLSCYMQALVSCT